MLLSQDIELQELCNACTNLVYIDTLVLQTKILPKVGRLQSQWSSYFDTWLNTVNIYNIYSYKPFQQTFLFEMHNIYTLACLSTMFLGYLFRHCFAIFVPNFWDFLSLTFASFCP